MFPIAICKILEDYKSKNFDEKYECLKLIHSWLKLSDTNFPLIFCQGIASMSKSDEVFKKGCIEFLRSLGVIRPDLCSSVGGFKILINSLLDINNYDIQDNIFYSLLFVINCPNKRKYFNGFDDFYKIFSVFTKSDFCEEVFIIEKSSLGNSNLKQSAEREEEKNKLNSQLHISKKLIKKMLKAWPGFSLIMGDNMSLGSMIQSLNTDINSTIKSSKLHLLKEILDANDSSSSVICSSKPLIFSLSLLLLASSCFSSVVVLFTPSSSLTKGASFLYIDSL